MKRIVILSTLLVFILACFCVANAAEAYNKGKLTATTFESKYIGLRFSLPENYIFATEEDLISLIDTGAKVAGIDEVTVDYAKMQTVYEMMVSAPSGIPNIIVMVEKLALSNMTEEQYVEALKTGLGAVPNIDYSFRKTSSTTIAGQKYTVLTASATINGVQIIQDYAVRKHDDRIVAFVITYTKDTAPTKDKLLAGFKRF